MLAEPVSDWRKPLAVVVVAVAGDADDGAADG